MALLAMCFCWIPILLMILLMFGFLGMIIGSNKEAGGLGFFLGFMLGPIGCLIAAFIDGRPQCPKCRERIPSGAKLCSHCGYDFVKAERHRLAQHEKNAELRERIRDEKRAASAKRWSARRDRLGDAFRSVINWTLQTAKRISDGVDGLLAKMAGDDVFMLWIFRVMLIFALVVAITAGIYFAFPLLMDALNSIQAR